MRLKTIIAAALLAALAACGGKQTVKAPDSVPQMAKAEVEAIVKEYLLREPEILVSAFNELERRRNEADFSAIIASNDDPSLGPKDAPITIVEFFDYNCPYCHQVVDWVMKQLEGKGGPVRVIFKEFPILRDSSHMAALAALSANRQGKYREMHVGLMKSKAISQLDATGQKEDLAKTQAEIDRIAKSIGMNLDRLHKDMEDPALQSQIARVSREAEATQTNGTPRFYINGLTHEGGINDPLLEELLKEAREKLAKKS